MRLRVLDNVIPALPLLKLIGNFHLEFLANFPLQSHESIFKKLLSVKQSQLPYLGCCAMNVYSVHQLSSSLDYRAGTKRWGILRTPVQEWNSLSLAETCLQRTVTILPRLLNLATLQMNPLLGLALQATNETVWRHYRSLATHPSHPSWVWNTRKMLPLPCWPAIATATSWLTNHAFNFRSCSCFPQPCFCEGINPSCDRCVVPWFSLAAQCSRGKPQCLCWIENVIASLL